MLQLVEALAQFRHDPLNFVRFAFKWGEGELEGMSGPEKWQERLLKDVRDGLKTPGQVIREAVASGHGIGKSAMVSWLILWSISTFPDTRGIVTANTATQLETKTWPELTKWYNRFIAKELFVCQATAIYSAEASHQKTWRIDAIPWSENNPEAFAGLHNQGKRILLLFDEASAIADIIWEVAEGAMTDANTEIIWAAFGNPTRNSGRFYECFHRDRAQWQTYQVDSRTVSFSNKGLMQEWIDTRGIDSDFVKIRVLGQFPSVGSKQLIPIGLIDDAAKRKLTERDVGGQPVILGVDVARFGDDRTVLTVRQGLWIKCQRTFSGLDTMAVAERVMTVMWEYKPHAVFIDGGAMGAGVIDRLRQLRYQVSEVNFGGAAMDAERYANIRTEMYFKCKEWLEAGGALPDISELKAELAVVEYDYNSRGKLILEPKEDIKERLGRSPDLADSVVLTFARPVYVASNNPLDDYQEDYDPLGNY
ncbi:MAG: terminase [Bacteroidales bacterium]|nr:terminase [Bacteroidales bacterium]